MAKGADYTVVVRADSQAVAKDILAGYALGKQQIEGDVVKYNISADPKQLKDIFDQLKKLPTDVNTNIVFNLDESAYQKELSRLISYSGRAAKSISKEFQKNINMDLEGSNIKDMLNEFVGEGTSKTRDGITKLVNTLKKDLSPAIKEGADYTDIVNQAMAYERLNKIVDEISKKNIKGLTTDDAIGQVIDVGKFKNDYAEFYNIAGSYIKKYNAEFTASFQQSFADVRNEFLQMFSKMFTSFKGGNITADLESISKAATEATDKLKDLKKQRMDMLQYSMKSSFKSGDDAKLMAYINEYLKHGGERSELSFIDKEGHDGLEEVLAMYDAHKGKFRDISKEFAEINAEIRASEIEAANFANQMAELAELKNVIQNAIGDTAGGVATEKLDAANQEIEKLNQRYSEQKAELDAITQKYSEQSDVVKELSSQLDDMKGKTDAYDSLKTKFDEQNKKLLDYIDLAERLQTYLNESQGKLSSLDGKDISAEEMATQVALVEDLQKKLAQVNSLYEQQENSIKELREEITRLTSENKALDEEAKENAAVGDQRAGELAIANEKLIEAKRLLAEQRAESDKLKESLDSVNIQLSECITNLRQFKFDPLEQARTQLGQFKEYGGHHYDKAASYYGLYREAGGTESIEFDGKDVSNELISRYKELNDELARSQELKNQLIQKNKETFSIQRQVEALEKEVAALKKVAEEREKLLKQVEAPAQPQENPQMNALMKRLQERQIKRDEAKKATTQPEKVPEEKPITPPEIKTDAEAQGMSTLAGKVNEVTAAVTRKNEEFDKERQTVDSVVDVEKQKLGELDQSIIDVIRSVDKKTQAFEEEGQTVSGVITSEVNDLSALDGWLDIIIKEINNLAEAIRTLPKIQIEFENAKIDTELAKYIEELKNAFTGIHPQTATILGEIIKQLKVKSDAGTNLQKLSNALLNFKSNLNNFSGDAKQMLSSIESLAKSEGIKDLAKVLSASEKKVNNARKNISGPSSTDEILDFSDESIKDVLPEWKKRYEKQLGGEIVKIVKSLQRDEKGGYRDSFKIEGKNGTKLTIGKNGDLLMGSGAVYDENAKQKELNKLLAETGHAIKDLNVAQSNLNSTKAKGILGQEVTEQFRETKTAVDEAAESAEKAMEKIRAAAKEGSITQEQLDKFEKKYSSAQKGSGKSRDEITKANKKVDDAAKAQQDAADKAQQDAAAKQAAENAEAAKKQAAEAQKVLDEKAKQDEKAKNDLLKEQVDILNDIYKTRTAIDKLESSDKEADKIALANRRQELSKLQSDFASNSRKLRKDYGISTADQRSHYSENTADSKADYEEQALKRVNKAYDDLIARAERYSEIKYKQDKGMKLLESEEKFMATWGPEYEAAAKGVGKYKTAVGDATDAQNRLNDALKAMEVTSAESFKSNTLSGISDEIKKLDAIDGKSKKYTDKIKELKSAFENLNTVDANEIFMSDELKDVNRLIQEIKKNSSNWTFASDMEKSNLTKNIQEWAERNTVAAKKYREEIDALLIRLQRMDLPKEEVAELNTQFNKLKATVAAAGDSGIAFGDKVKKRFSDLAAYLASFASFYDVINVMRQGVTILQEIDTAQTELIKVADASNMRLQTSFSNSIETAEDLKASISDAISATADWSRTGYGIEAAEELARASILYKNVGDGMDITAANESLVSTLQGFQLEAEKVINVVDIFNEVANNMPIDSAGIGEALQRSAASFNAANTDLSEAVALIVGSNSVLQDPSRVGNMWKTVSARIRGASLELEEAGESTEGMVESTSQLRGIIKDLTGFDIMLDENTFKNMKDIIVGIGKEWNNLTDIEQSGLLEKLAGKTQANALAAALENYKLIEEAYEIAQNSEGSALREQEAWEKSLEAKIQGLNTALQKLATITIDSGFFGDIIDSGKTLVDVFADIIDNAGVITTLLGVGGGILGTKSGFGKRRSFKMPFFIRLHNNAMQLT